MNMKSAQVVLTAVLGLGSTGSVMAAEEFASPKEAEALVKKAVAAIKADRDKTLADITAKDAKWTDRDLYLTVYTPAGVALAHGQNAKQVGKDLIELKDPDGKPFIKERMDLAESKGKFWQDYKFTDPVTKKVLPKSMYCEKGGDFIACAGVYKR